MEFVGDGIQYLSMDYIFTIANMAIEAGGNSVFSQLMRKQLSMLKNILKHSVVFEANEDAVYDAVYEIDLSTLRPTVVFPNAT